MLTAASGLEVMRLLKIVTKFNLEVILVEC